MALCRNDSLRHLLLTWRGNHWYRFSWRYKSDASKKGKAGKSSKRYSDTLNLPQTTFPLSMKNGAATQREMEIQKMEKFETLYAWQRKQDWKEEFILHDGPPYANGKTHVGHFVNKVLKDITNRYNMLKRRKVNYIPGWDCHGMPIEVKAIAKAGKSNLTPQEIRTKARAFATQAIEDQKASFKSWGIMADWSNIYTTFSPQYQAKQLEIFYKIYEKGYIYRDYMPVYWSPSSQTALAEAELEYNPNHVSKSVYLVLPLMPQSSPLYTHLDPDIKVHAVIWTTTPWTLPFNRAICFNPNHRYVILKNFSTSSAYLCEEIFADKLKSLLTGDTKLLCTVDGHALEGCTYQHPLSKEKLPFLPSDHVQSGKGTGLVHTAPPHGHDDFQIALEHDLSVECHIDEKGAYISGVDESLLGKTVGADAEEAVLSRLTPWVLQTEPYTHSYPYDWRTKKPVFIRASLQWFINTRTLHKKALESLSEVKITPARSERGMLVELNSRPYWCISRQRNWGVPIPIFYHQPSQEPFITRESVAHLCEMIHKHGPDCWWELSVADLLPDHLLHKHGKGSSADYVKGTDILDIWFDSGTSWGSVLNERRADMYLEGLDQFKGWFQTSLLTSVAVCGHAPYRQIVTHAFATDEQGKKMSKSVGNVVDPHEVIYGGPTKESPAYGVDTLRWWVAHSHHHQQIMVGPTILTGFFEEVFKVRKCMRHLLGCLSDFDPARHTLPYRDLTYVDKYMLHKVYATMQRIEESYDTITYNKIIQALEKFMYADLSRFYIHITRDRCYCSGADSVVRRSSQTTMYHIVRTLTSAFAPILPHLAEEIYEYLPHTADDRDSASVFQQGWQGAMPEWNDPQLANSFLPVLDIYRALHEELDTENLMEFDVIIYSSPKLHDLLRILQPEVTSTTSSLCEILQTAQVTVLDSRPVVIPDDAVIVKGSTQLCDTLVSEEETVEVDFKLLLMSSMLNLCERCRRYTAHSRKKPCQRCMDVLSQGWAS